MPKPSTSSASWRIDWRLTFWLWALLVGSFQLALVSLYGGASDDANHQHRNHNGDLVYLLNIPPPRPARRELKWKRVEDDAVPVLLVGENKADGGDSRSGRGISSSSTDHSIQMTNTPIQEPATSPKDTTDEDKVPKLKKKTKDKDKSKETHVHNEKTPASRTSTAFSVAAQMQEIQKAGKLYSIGRKDRSGSVITDQMFAHAFAFAHGVAYAGACFTTKGLPKRDTQTLLSQLKWDSYLKFGCPQGESIVNDPDAGKSPLVLHPDVYRHKLEQSYFTKAWKDEIQRLLLQHGNIRNGEALKTKEEKRKPFEIAVHVRRGDVTPCRYQRRYLPNVHYLALIDQYLPKDNGDTRPVHVTIYSESDSFEPFDDFLARGYTVQLDTDLAEAWKAFASADVTILSRSYFSFVPAAVNPNTVVYTAFFQFAPLEGWHLASEALVAKTDQQIRHIYDTQCNATAIELERQLQEQIHAGTDQER